MSDFASQLEDRWLTTNSMLCVGLDPALERISSKYGQSASERMWNFCRSVIDATAKFACAFKPQIAFFSAVGRESVLEQVIRYIHEKYPQIPVILDAKRGDIGSTAERYAQEAFERYEADAVTVNPYLGWDTIEPFLRYSGKGVAILCMTSNAGSSWLQSQPQENPIYLQIADSVIDKADPNLMLVVGATNPKALIDIRERGSEIHVLVPGLGTQGGQAKAVLQARRKNRGGGLVVNVSRAILYGESGSNLTESGFADRANAFANQLPSTLD